MITVFVDDSGTSPDQQIAIASALIVESSRTGSLNNEVAALYGEEGFSYFHASECVAGNRESEFKDWDYDKKRRVCSRMRQIAMKYGVNALSIAIDKRIYDEVVPRGARKGLGEFHYTLAVGFMVEFLERWRTDAKVGYPLEYIFDWMGEDKRNPAKKEIEIVMAKAEERRPANYRGHYTFRRSRDTPGLQCADILAWTCYKFAVLKIAGTPVHEIVKEGFAEFAAYHPCNSKWLQAIVQTREQLTKWVAEELKDT